MADLNILIVDDHPLYTGGFVHMARSLRPDWELRSVDCAPAALLAVAAELPDLAIVDVGLPGDDGFSLLASLADAAPCMPVILISGRNDAAVRVRARAGGAAGFIAKTQAPGAIVAVIETVMAGGTGFGDESANGTIPVLTPRQAEVLGLLAEGHANKEIRHRLGIAERTVRAHLTELFQLLGAQSRMQAVLRGRELGLIGR